MLKACNQIDLRWLRNRVFLFPLIAFVFWMSGCTKEELTDRLLKIMSLTIGTVPIDIQGGRTEGVPVNSPILVAFDARVSPETVLNNVTLRKGADRVDFEVRYLSEGKTLSLSPRRPLQENTAYTLVIGSDLRGVSGERYPGLSVEFVTQLRNLSPVAFRAEGAGTSGVRVINVPLDFVCELEFNVSLNPQSINAEGFILQSSDDRIAVRVSLTENGNVLNIQSLRPLSNLARYQLLLAEGCLRGLNGEAFAGFSQTFYTTSQSAPKFPPLSDTELLTQVQRQTFKYFYDVAHPASGMARERHTSDDLVTTGGSGFGVMALIVGMERGFITRAQGLQQLDRILDFLETCDRFHGAWPHWINGNTGKTIPFSANDNGADLVETSFMIQGLLTMRQYLQPADALELALINRINMLWQAVEWDWFTRGGQNVLYWHWSPDKGWAMNMTISGYNEALITYVLAAASPTHPVASSVYTQGWARNGAIRNNRSFYNIALPVGYDFGGPLFFAHYSFLGLDPRGLSDTYANYWQQNVNHSLINRAYCIANPKNFVGYSSTCWGLTASDNHVGYSAHSPTNDLGVIAPTAALSSFPFTPAESMDALKFFYYTLGDRLWGEYGFYDAFNITEGWVANSYLAIDQGPIVVMIENYRTGLLWSLFMSAPEVQNGLSTLGFIRSN